MTRTTSTPPHRSSPPHPFGADGEPRVWVLNLDAEHELEARGRYTPNQHLHALVRRQAPRLLGELVGPGDRILTEEELEPGCAEGSIGLAWSPTPRALALLRKAGARAPDAPAIDVLRGVNARPFAAAVRAAFAGASFAKEVVASLDEALEHVARPAPLGWLVRRTFGAAGRGRRRLACGRPSSAERAWLAASLRLGPLVVEPWVQVTREVTRSGWVERDGGVVIAPPCFQETTERGAWIRSGAAAPDEVRRADDERLEAIVEATGASLATAGYFGPFGIDAFHHRPLEGGGADVLNPMSEINARFTMDWVTGMGARTPHRR